MDWRVDPSRLSSTFILSGGELRERVERNERLLHVAEPVLADLFYRVRGSNTIIFLIDPEGCILKAVGDPEITDRTVAVNLREGALWLEQYRGTNAIGTALAEGSPVMVLGEEHFCEPIHFLSCFASPIRDRCGQLLGIVDATVFSEHSHPHTLGLVTAVARAIEDRLYLYEMQAQVSQLSDQTRAVLDLIPEGALILDDELVIRSVNRLGADLLGLRSPEDYVGRPAQEVLPEEVWRVLRATRGSAGQLREEMVRLYRWPYPVTVHARLLPGEHGSRACGLVAVLRPAEDRPAPPGDGPRYTFDCIIGNSPSLQAAIALARRAAENDSTVLLQAETGTGKELFAQAIHNGGARADGPFVAVNCGALPSELVESELFGYEEGAFTGARRRGKPGKFEEANGGTLFLDEIGEMPLPSQVALLRVLQERQVVRLGGQKAIPVDVRVIAATNKDLLTEVQAGRFRADLYYRLNVLRIEIPPLRERGEDVVHLARFQLRRLCVKYRRPQVRLSPDAEELLQAYSWPGNIRELYNVVERALLVCADDVIRPEHLPVEIRGTTGRSQLLMPGANLAAAGSAPAALEAVELQAIRDALERFGGNVARAARFLGISRNTVYRKLKKLEENPALLGVGSERAKAEHPASKRDRDLPRPASHAENRRT